MKVKKYLYLAAAVSISICAVVFGFNRYLFDHSIDALTRPSEDTALCLLSTIQYVWVEVEIRSNVPSYYEQLSSKNLSAEIAKQLEENTDILVYREYADGDILVDIQLKGRKETEFVAVSIAVSVANTAMKRFSFSDYTGITWQSQKTLLVHKNKIMEEVPKDLQYLVRHLCTLLPHHRKAWEKSQAKKQKDQQKQ
jgi:hypothetical protein